MASFGKEDKKLNVLIRKFDIPLVGRPSLDHLLVLVAVAEAGSFRAAATRLGRATSAVSYAIDTLEQQLGVALFDRGSTRRPTLTEQGEAVVAEARAVALSVETLRARVRGFAAGLEAELSLVVDSLLPGNRLAELLREFQVRFPTVPVRLLVETLGGVEKLVRSGEAGIGVGSHLHMDMTGFERTDIASVKLIPVAAPHHPLARATPAERVEPGSFIQLVLSQQSAGAPGQGVVSLNFWRIGDTAAKHQLLLAGIGWGGMPEPNVRADIAAGRLVHLDLPSWRGGDYPLLAIHKTDTPPGPAGRWLIGRLATLFDEDA